MLPTHCRRGPYLCRLRERARQLTAVALFATVLAGCGGGAVANVNPAASAHTTTAGSRSVPAEGHPGSRSSSSRAASSVRSKPAYPPYPVLGSLGAPRAAWRAVVSIRGLTAAWIAQRDGATLLRFDQRLVTLALHAGSLDPGAGSWHYGDAIVHGEAHRLIAAFNSGFRLNTHSGGWQSYGHTPVPLSDGLASIVTYRDGTTDIGVWHGGVPARRPIVSVRQNLHLLVDGGVAAANVDSCVEACWGATLGGGSSVARSALGVTVGQMLVWAGVSSSTPSTLARALISGGVTRAAELDINPSWVAGYLYRHGHGRITSVPVVPGQFGVAGHFLTPYSRDFFAVIER